MAYALMWRSKILTKILTIKTWKITDIFCALPFNSYLDYISRKKLRSACNLVPMLWLSAFWINTKLCLKKKLKENKRWWFFKRFAVSYNYIAVKKIVKIKIAAGKQAGRRRDKGMKPNCQRTNQPSERTINQKTNQTDPSIRNAS